MQLNFNGGQVSENFTPRVDMQKYQTSCSLMRNFIPRQFGMLKRRPGFGVIDAFKNPFRILKFPCTNNEEYIVCVHSDNKYEGGGCTPFATIYQCGYFGDETRKWEVNLEIDSVFRLASTDGRLMLAMRGMGVLGHGLGENQVCLPKRQNVDSASRLLPAGINKDSHTGENA